MSLPTNQPRWANLATDPAQRTAPGSSLADVGWAVNARPAAQHLNWLFYTIYQWVLYLNGLTGEALTWSAAHVFNGTVSFAGTIIGAVTAVAAWTFSTAPTAPDYHFTSARTRRIPATAGHDNSTVDTWSATASTVASSVAGAIAFSIPVVADEGDTITISVVLSQSTAVAGGSVFLYRTDDTGSGPTTVATNSIANATGVQVISIATNHAVVTGNSYAVGIQFAAGASNKAIYHVIDAWKH